MEEHTVGLLGLAHVQLAQAEIAQGDMTGVIEQYVLWLEIAIDDVEAVQMLERTQELCSIEPTPVLIKLPLTLEMIKELSTVNYSVERETRGSQK
jgi:hypothetical protein